MQKNIIVAPLPCAIPAVMYWFQQRAECVPFHIERDGIYYKICIGNIIFKEYSIDIFFFIAFKDMLEFNAMVKGMFPQVRVLFVFPLTYRVFLLNEAVELKDPKIIQLPW